MADGSYFNNIDLSSLTLEQQKRAHKWREAEQDLSDGPDLEKLKDAPLLNNWIMVPVGGGTMTLNADVTGHPTINNCRMTTSPVLRVNPDAGWARTRNRWYRLGLSMGEPDLTLKGESAANAPAPRRQQ